MTGGVGVELRGVTKRYGDVPVLRGVELTQNLHTCEPPEPGEGVQDVRSGSLAMPLAVLMVVLVGVIVYAVVR